MLRRSGVAALIGEDHIYHTVDDGVHDFLSWPPAAPLAARGS
jgi:hypothetical protein